MKLKNNILGVPFLILLFSLFLSSCGIYSFTGTTISPDIRTIAIENFENPTGEGPANLTQVVTTTFKNYYRRNSNLTILQSNGDLELEGRIVSFTVTPAAIQRDGQQDIATLNRLTLGIQIRFTNKKSPDEDFDQLFTITKDFDQNRDMTQLSAAEIEEMTERLVADVFNKTVANW
jgi:hypothetical protein